MNLLAMCITWNRPHLLGRAIHCFLQQTDPNARLFVLDDAGQYISQEHERWTLVSVKDRYPTMGDKRNALIDMAIKHYPQLGGFMLWDDDDANWPHAAECVSKALDEKCWARPMSVFEMSENGGSLKRVQTYKQKENLDRSICYGGCWAWRLDVFFDLGQFESTNSGEDIKLARPCFNKYGPSANSTPGEPWHYYNRENNSIVGEGRNFYGLRGNQTIEPVAEIPIGWNGTNLYEMPIEPGIYPRPW